MDFIASFIEFMEKHGCAPANPDVIMGNDKRQRYQLADEHKGKRSGSYQLRVDSEFAVGWCRSFREGVTHPFTSRSKSTWTGEEKTAWKLRVEAKQKENAEKRRAERKAAATKAAKIWAKVAWEGSTAYLERKKAGLHSAGIYRGLVVVPVRIDRKLSSLQFISPAGEKRFLAGSELVGGYFDIIEESDDKSIIVLCEGFATGDAVRQAVDLPVRVAFNAGNLKPVALELKKQFPESRIIIAADNDQWTKNHKGEPWNPGIHYARQAAVAIGAQVIAPLVDAGDEMRRTDFNDILVSDGIEAVRSRILDVVAHQQENNDEFYVSGGEDSLRFGGDVQPSTADTQSSEYDGPQAPPVEAYDDILPSIKTLPKNANWRDLLLTNAEGKLKTSSLRNGILFLQFHPDFTNIFAYNEFHQNIMITGCPPWEREESFAVKRLDDISITQTSAELEKYMLTLGTDKVFKAIQVAANERRFHPAREYFNRLVWDGKPRLATWLTYYLGCEKENPKYLAAIGTKWLVAGVKRVFEPGCKFDHVLVLEGEQGIGKSLALKALATFGEENQESYYTDAINLAKLDDKDTTMMLQGSIIIELAELSGFSKQTDEEIKKWLALQFDDARLPYSREVTRFFRQFILAATTNKYSYLKDPTGHRRFWPGVAMSIDIESITKDREQLWAEAVKYYRERMNIWLNPEEEKLANIEREKRMMQDAWTDRVLMDVKEIEFEKAASSDRGFNTEEVLVAMGLPLRDRDDRAFRRVSNILQMAGYENRSLYSSETKRSQRRWVKKSTEAEG